MERADTLPPHQQDTERLPARRRPFGVAVIATLQVLSGIGWAVLVYLDRPAWGRWLGGFGYHEYAGPALGLAGLFLAYGLFTLRRRAWVLTMLWAGLNLTLALYGWWHEQPAYIAMVLSVIIVYYLNQREVQAAFHVTMRHAESGDD